LTKVKAEACTLRAQTATGSAYRDQEQVTRRLMERMQVVEAEITSSGGTRNHRIDGVSQRGMKQADHDPTISQKRLPAILLDNDPEKLENLLTKATADGLDAGLIILSERLKGQTSFRIEPLPLPTNSQHPPSPAQSRPPHCEIAHPSVLPLISVPHRHPLPCPPSLPLLCSPVLECTAAPHMPQGAAVASKVVEKVRKRRTKMYRVGSSP